MVVSQNTQGASDTAAIKQTINTLLDAIGKVDSTLARFVLSKGMIKQRVSNDANGKAMLSTKNEGDLVKAIGNPRAEVYAEKIVYDVIKIDGNFLKHTNGDDENNWTYRRNELAFHDRLLSHH